MNNKQEKLIRFKDGNLYCELADIWIDPNKPVKRALITHAHFDHFAFGCEEYISTRET
ncbi:DNA ligase-associated DEXH box helicase, partial [Prochlorococcus sp. AH-736-K20]|nr:DNA ligase-associated DEXH box helicase [Prochlorococcus sp. AH-736-K20]